jgi:alpha-L-rhamnosidase
MSPKPVGDLKYVNAEYNSIRGLIKSNWKKDKNSFTWEITIPVGSKALLTVPTDDILKITVNGEPVKTNADGKIEISSGTYQIITFGKSNH